MFNKLKTISLADVTVRLHCSTWGKLWFHGSNDSLILCLAVEDKYNNSNISENNESIKLKLGISNVPYERRKMTLTMILSHRRPRRSMCRWMNILILTFSDTYYVWAACDCCRNSLGLSLFLRRNKHYHLRVWKKKHKIFKMPMNIFKVFFNYLSPSIYCLNSHTKTLCLPAFWELRNMISLMKLLC